MIVGKVQSQKTYSYADVLNSAKALMKEAVAEAYKDLTGKDKMSKALRQKLENDGPERVLAMDATLKSLRGQS